MTTVYDVPPDALIQNVSSKLQKDDNIQPPEWAEFVKTGVHKEKAPVQEDWWFLRTAAVLRKVYTLGPIGVSHLRTEFGGAVDRGAKPYHTKKGSGAIIRLVLHQLEEGGYVVKDKKKGRIVTPKGQSFLDNCAHEIKRELIKELPELKKY